jgi:PP-loop superfamily ATP-utilizing enzyme
MRVNSTFDGGSREMQLEVTMRKLLVAATALGLITASLPAMAAESAANKPVPAGVAMAKPKFAKVGRFKHHAKRTHRKHFVRHHRHHRMALHNVHRKHLVLHKKHQVRKTAKPAARNG